MSEIIHSEQIANELAENPLLKFMELFSVFDPYLLGQTDRQRTKLYAELLKLFQRVSHPDKGFLPNHDLFALVGRALTQLDDPLERLSTMEQYSEDKRNRRARETARAQRIEQERGENTQLRELLNKANAQVEELRQQIGTNSREQALLLTRATVAPAMTIVDKTAYRSRLVADPVSLKSIDLLAWVSSCDSSPKESHDLTAALYEKGSKIPYGPFLHRPTKEMKRIAKFASPDLGLSETAWREAIFETLSWIKKMGTLANQAALVPIRVPVDKGVFSFPWQPERFYKILGAAEETITGIDDGPWGLSGIRVRATCIVKADPFLSLNTGLIATEPFEVKVQDEDEYLAMDSDSEISARTRRALGHSVKGTEEVIKVMTSDDPRLEAGGVRILRDRVAEAMSLALDRPLEVPGLILGLHT